MLKEFCAENFTDIPKAIQAGADRIELCDNLAVGGTTPSFGVMKLTLEYCSKHSIPVMTMIRPRGGNFNYTLAEIEIMKQDIKMAKEVKTDGVVFGCLTYENRINREQIKALLPLCKGCEVTFHMAFDQIPIEYQLEELEWLISQNITRILTHGGINGSLQDNGEKINKLIEHATGRIEILPGGGVTYKNLPQVAKIIAANQFHGTKIIEFNK